MKKFKSYKTEISIPNNVEIKKKQNNLIFYGPKGSTELNLKKLDIFGKSVLYFPKDNKKNLILSSNCKSFFSCISHIIENKIMGVSSGFLLSMRIAGVGYRADIIKNKTNQILCLKIGFSHDLEYIIPLSIRVFLLEPTLICLYGLDKNQITQIAAKIKKFKIPSVYKKKGIFLIDEVIFTKQGKKK